MLNYLMNTNDCYPNAYVAYRILSTISIANVERSFSKFKLIKIYSINDKCNFRLRFSVFFS